jgi:hypothetical protein
MDSIRDDVIGGFNSFLAAQRAEPGAATLTLVQFDTQDPYEVVHRFVPIAEVPALDRETFVPRSGTPLLDTLGRGIADLEATLSALAEPERPEKIVVAILTDGQENASCEFRRDDVLRMIREQTDRAGWQFVFLSADAAAIGEAHEIGISKGSTLRFKGDARGTAAAFDSLSRGISDVRSRKKRRIGFAESDTEPAEKT